MQVSPGQSRFMRHSYEDLIHVDCAVGAGPGGARGRTNHLADELAKACLMPPAELLMRLGRIPDQEIQQFSKV